MSFREDYYRVWYYRRGMYQGLAAQNLAHARAMAALASERHGSATITNNAGLVATYVMGDEWRPRGLAD